jgi:cyclophilin family peptidyl-prolyl cis-trans isomerase
MLAVMTKLVLRVAAVCLAAAACRAQTPPAAPAKPAETKPAREPGLYAIMQTSLGTIVMKLFENEAPVTVKNFTDLARGAKAWKHPGTGQMMKKPLYNGLTFHRVIPGFMIQGGDPLGSGMGGTENIIDEFHPSLKFDTPGRLAMANTGEPKTGSCQFFITEGLTPHLNGRHTIFGQVVEGQEVVNKIATVPRDADDKPKTPVKIVSVLIRREGPAAVTTRKAAPAVKKAAGTTAKKTATPAAKKTTPPPKTTTAPK